jgi:heme-degrading monooxygenase HmoA
MSPQYITKITFCSRLSRDQAIAVMKERMPAFSKLEGLIQKYYAETSEPDTYSGIYCWASKEAMDAFLKMPLKQSIASAYKSDGEPDIEILSVLCTLHPQ